MCSVTLPLILAFLLVGADMRSDLSELKPLKPAIDGTTLLLGWQELESGAMESALRLRHRAGIFVRRCECWAT